MTSSDAYIALNLLSGIGPVRVKQLLATYGAPENLLGRPVEELGRYADTRMAHTVANWRELADLDGELRRADEAGVRIVTPADDDYPELLREIHDPPLALYVHGQVSALSRAGQCGLAVVGSRRHTTYGIATTQRLVASAVQAGWIIVSGLAYGIDTAAHSTTVEHDGCTIAVLAGGLANIYPKDNQELARRITARGALVSEQPLLMKPDKRFFPMRNRIIAGLCRGTLVVEAGLNSGALITAQQAVEQGRLVYAVPGRVDAPQSRGCHHLIKQGARLVETLDDIQEEVSFLPGMELFADTGNPLSTPNRQSAAPAPDLAPNEASLVDCLRLGEASLDELTAQAGQPVHAVLAALSMLEIKRVVRQLPGRRYALYNT